MYILRMLGGIGLSDEKGRDVDALLRQPKQVALLAYLAMPRPGTWHRRDSLLGTLWPDVDQLRARTALRSALYTLRRHLAEGAIRTRGDDEVSLDSQLVTTDVAAMIDAIAAGNHDAVLERYAGDFLPGLHIDEAEGFEKWLAQERSHLNALARKAAMSLADTRERSRDISGAIEAARRASELDPDDEVAARRWIALLDRSGDRAGAFAVYERFRRHVAEEFGTRPSAETVALVDAVRTRREANVPATTAASTTPHPILAPLTTERLPISDLVVHDPVAGQIAARRNLNWFWPLVAIVLVAAVGALTALRGRGESKSAVAARSLVVLPSENETGDAKLAYIGAGIADGVAHRLEGIGGMSIRSGARSDWPSATLHDYKTISREFGSTVLLRTAIARVGDSLEIRASVVDARTSGERSIAARRFALSQIRDIESSVAADVAGAVFRVPLPAIPRESARPIDPESYRLMLEGWHQLLGTRARQGGMQFFQKAVEIDPTNARAWAGLSSAWAAQALSEVPFEVGYDRSSAAAARALALDSLQGSAWGNLAVMRALKYRSVAVALELLKKAVAAEPGNPEIFLIQSALFRYAHQWDQARDAIRLARALDPLSPVYAEREAFTELCAEQPAEALRLFEAALIAYPEYKPAQVGLQRSLARLGRYDEAITTWRPSADSTNQELIDALSHAHGAKGYWEAKHVEGRSGLTAIEKEQQRGYVPAHRVMQARFLAGDTDGGFKVLEKALADRDQRLYHLPCMPGVDEVRDTPRFKAILARVGPLPAK